MNVNWKDLIKRFFGFMGKIWDAVPSEYRKYIVGIWLIIIGNLPVWRLFSFGSYVQAGCILGGILYMFSNQLGGLLGNKALEPTMITKQRYCSNCGRRLKGKEEFCSKCGIARREL